MGDDDKEEGKEEIDSDAEPERLQYKVKSTSTKLQTLHSPIDHIFVAFKKIINGIMAIIS